MKEIVKASVFEEFNKTCRANGLSLIEGAGIVFGKIKINDKSHDMFKPARDPLYLQYIRMLPCEGYPESGCNKMESVAHHYGVHALSEKTDDYRTFPLCPICHGNWHQHPPISENDDLYYTDLCLFHIINYLKITRG